MSGPATPQSSSPSRRASVGRSAFLVAAGIFLSRIFGLVRDRVFGHFFGIGDAADAFRGAMRIPNLLQNLFGEGVLSASFIPVYARLLAEGDEKEAGRVAGAVFSLLALVTSVLVLAGVLATPWLIDLIVPGFKGETRLLAIELVRIFFPGVGLLVLSTWCLGILNSHGKFFLSYVSPVIWNLSIIVALLWFGNHAALPRLAMDTAWASVVGSGLQFLVQVPFVIKLAPGLKFFVTTLGENVRVVLRNFLPAFMGRGVNQLSAYVDTLLASFLPAGSVAALFNAQTLNMLPVSLFGMSVSAAELPAMSSTLGQEQEIAAALRTRIAASTRRIGFFVVPSAIAFLALGDVIAAAIFQTGAFRRADTDRVWSILAGSAVGLVASTVGRLYSSAYYALRDTRTPLKFATIRVLLTAGLGYLAALRLPGWLGVNPIWGAAGLTATAGFAAWIEFLLLRRGMNARIGRSEFPTAYFVKLWSAAIVAAGLAWGVRVALRPHQPQIAALMILIPYGVAYLALAMAFGIDEARSFTKRLARGRP